MNLDPNLVTLAGGAGVLALCAILLSANRRRDALVKIALGAVIGAIAFRLRELTGRNGYYDVLYAYVPLMALGGQPFQAYVRWWLTLFGVLEPR